MVKAAMADRRPHQNPFKKHTQTLSTSILDQASCLFNPSPLLSSPYKTQKYSNNPNFIYIERERERERERHTQTIFVSLKMGNAVSPCFHQSSRSAVVKLIFWEGTTRILTGSNKHVAGEIMFQNPDKMVCHADSFFIGHPVPSLAIDEELMPGQTYFVLPLDRFASNVLSVSSLAGFSSSPNRAPINFGESPFQYMKGAEGRVLIKVVPEFITRLINRGGDQDQTGCTSPGNSFLCSTPELKKHYEQLVGSKEQTWSPKLDTISEYKTRYSPCRFIGLEWKQKEQA